MQVSMNPGTMIALVVLVCLGIAVLAGSEAGSFPWLAVERTKSCQTCHVSPSGGGQRTEYGNLEIANQYLSLPYTRALISAHEQSPQVSKSLLVGFDSRHTVDDEGTVVREQADAYLTFTPHQRLVFHLDFGEEGIGEHFGLVYVDEDRSLYGRIGRFYPSFGLRTESYRGYHRTVTGHRRGLILDGAAVGYTTRASQLVFEAFNNNSQDIFGIHAMTGGKLGAVRWLSGFSWRLSKEMDGSYREAPHAKALFAGLSVSRFAVLGEIDLVGKGSDTLVAYASARARVVEGAWLAVDYDFMDPDRQLTTGVDEMVTVAAQVYPLPFVEVRPAYLYHTRGPLQDVDEFEVQVHFGY